MLPVAGPARTVEQREQSPVVQVARARSTAPGP